MLYSIGKDSSVLLHLARKAFHPGKLPFPLLHIDTTWKFREMIAFRDATAARLGIELIVHTNQDGLAQGINPIASGSALHTQVMKTEALKQALDKFGFDVAIGGARRDEEKSRAKERIFSFRAAGHSWDPRHQRPELWHVFNTRLRPGESMRIFPLSTGPSSMCGNTSSPRTSSWCRSISPRSARSCGVAMSGSWSTTIACRWNRAKPRNCGACGSVPSAATRSVARSSPTRRARPTSSPSCAARGDRSARGRLIDSDEDSSMERKKREGYF